MRVRVWDKASQASAFSVFLTRLPIQKYVFSEFSTRLRIEKYFLGVFSTRLQRFPIQRCTCSVDSTYFPIQKYVLWSEIRRMLFRNRGRHAGRPSRGARVGRYRAGWMLPGGTPPGPLGGVGA